MCVEFRAVWKAFVGSVAITFGKDFHFAQTAMIIQKVETLTAIQPSVIALCVIACECEAPQNKQKGRARAKTQALTVPLPTPIMDLCLKS